MNIIPINLSSSDIEKIDNLIKRGKYENRGQAITEFISRALEEEALIEMEEGINISKINDLLEFVLDKRKGNGSILEIGSSKTAIELVAEGRDG